MRQHDTRAGRQTGPDKGRWAAFAVVAALWFSVLPVRASELGPVFHNISVNQGLPDRRAEALVQDTHGFVWIGTRGGLVRHEGHRLRLVESGPDPSNSLPGVNITALAAHSDGTVWAAVESRGLVQLDSAFRRERHLDLASRGGRLPESSIWSLTEDCSGRVWMAFMRGGVAVYDPDDDTLRRFAQEGRTGLDPGGFQVQVVRDSECRIWVVQTGRIALFDPLAQRFRAIEGPTGTGPHMALADIDGRVYFNRGRTLYTLGPVESAEKAKPRAVIELDGVVTALAGHPDSRALLVATTAGLSQIDPDKSRLVEHVEPSSGLADGLPSGAIDGLLIDREGGLWLTTTRSGVAYLPPGASAFDRYRPEPVGQSETAIGIDPILSLAWDARRAGFWIGGLDGALGFQPLRDTPDRSPLDALAEVDMLEGANVVGLLLEADALYVATQTRVVRFDLNERVARTLLERRQLAAGTFAMIRRKSAGQLWVGTRDRGVFLIDERTGAVARFHPEGRAREHLPERSPRTLLPGPNDDWWLVAGGGLYRWHEVDGFERVRTPGLNRFAAGAWHGDALWLASDGRLVKWRLDADGRLKPQRTWSLTENLPPGRMIDVVPDRAGRIWLLRSSGLSVMRPGAGGFRHLSERDGLAAVEFGEHAVARLPDGRLAFGGRGGLVTVDPDRLAGVRRRPSVHVTRLSAGDRVIDLAPGTKRHSPARLDHDDNHVSLDYVATTYLSPERTRYRVRLDGWDTRWLELTGQTRHHYSNLPPGSYRFRVQAAAPGGTWGDAESTLPFVIESPPWLNKWAIGAYALLAATGAGLGLRSHQRARRRRHAIRRSRQRRAVAEQASAAKSDFIATMSHEIRTPLHGVLGTVELLGKSGLDPAQAAWVENLGRSGRQLRRIIDDALDLSRIEAGRLELVDCDFDLMHALEQVIDLHAPAAQAKGLDLRLRCSSDLPTYAHGDCGRLGQVLGNLVSNAVKFTEHGGIELCAEAGRDGWLVLIVSDAGPGIGDSERRRLFEPFTQLQPDEDGQGSSSGLGLAICRRLVEAMDGRIDLLNSRFAGARFRVRLPLIDPDRPRLPLTGLLAGYRVAACVSSPTLRILRRLGQRWGFDCVDARPAPVDCELLLLGPESVPPESEAWRRRAEDVIWLCGAAFGEGANPVGATSGEEILSGPLTESRLIARLFELRAGWR